MTNKKTYLLPAIIFTMIVTALALYAFTNNMRTALGSTITGNDYFSTTTVAGVASATAPLIVSARPGTLASIIVASSSTAFNSVIRVYDNAVATGTMPTGLSSGVAVSTSTLIATLPQGATAGTYTFDLVMSKGIVVDVPTGFNGSYVITYR